MNMLWTQLRQSEKVAFAVHKWSDKPAAERTYEELLERFRAWLVEQRSYQNYLKATRRTNSDKPNIAGMQSDVGEKQAKKGKNKKKNKNDGPGDASDVAAVVNKSGNNSIASRRQDGSKPKTKCLNFQEEYGMKGCTRKPKCPYLHERCETKEEFEALLNKVTMSANSSDSDKGRGKGKAKGVSKGKEFRLKFCRYADSCKFKGTDKCKRDHTTYPTLEKWKAGLKALTGTDGGSSSDSQ